MTLRLDLGGILCLLPKGLDSQGPQSVVLLTEKEQRGRVPERPPPAGVGVWCKRWDLTTLLGTALSRKPRESPARLPELCPRTGGLSRVPGLGETDLDMGFSACL